jgi:excisionase family DNA binding protein
MTRLLSIPKVAEALSVHRSTVYRLIAEGAFPVTRFGGSVRISEEALDEYIKRNTDPAYRRVG